MCYYVDLSQKARDQAAEVLQRYNVVVTEKDIFSRCQVTFIRNSCVQKIAWHIDRPRGWELCEWLCNRDTIHNSFVMGFKPNVPSDARKALPFFATSTLTNLSFWTMKTCLPLQIKFCQNSQVCNGDKYLLVSPSDMRRAYERKKTILETVGEMYWVSFIASFQKLDRPMTLTPLCILTCTECCFQVGLFESNFSLDEINLEHVTVGNGVVVQVEAIHEQKVDSVDVFYVCFTCGKVFWEGKHFSQVCTQFAHIIKKDGSSLRQNGVDNEAKGSISWLNVYGAKNFRPSPFSCFQLIEMDLWHFIGLSDLVLKKGFQKFACISTKCLPSIELMKQKKFSTVDSFCVSNSRILQVVSFSNMCRNIYWSFILIYMRAKVWNKLYKSF